MIGLLADIGVALVAVLHIGFMVLEMFLWQQPLGRRLFRNDAEFAARSAVLAANQGLYNGFLAAGLIWSFFAGDHGHDLRVFFLACIVAAGGYGAWSVSRRIFWVQAAPAAAVLALVWFG